MTIQILPPKEDVRGAAGLAPRGASGIAAAHRFLVASARHRERERRRREADRRLLLFIGAGLWILAVGLAQRWAGGA